MPIFQSSQRQVGMKLLVASAVCLDKKIEILYIQPLRTNMEGSHISTMPCQMVFSHIFHYFPIFTSGCGSLLLLLLLLTLMIAITIYLVYLNSMTDFFVPYPRFQLRNHLLNCPKSAWMSFAEVVKIRAKQNNRCCRKNPAASKWKQCQWIFPPAWCFHKISCAPMSGSFVFRNFHWHLEHVEVWKVFISWRP